MTDYTAKVDGYNITNTYSPSHTDVTVRKEWDDSNNAEGLRPEYVMVNLLSNGTVFANAELRDSNSWTHTFQNLPIAKAALPAAIPFRNCLRVIIFCSSSPRAGCLCLMMNDTLIMFSLYRLKNQSF